MIHPSDLLRTDSLAVRTFSAPRNDNLDNGEYRLDCGLTNLPIFDRLCNLERFANVKAFVIFLSLVGFLQGVTLTYFRETAELWTRHYNIPKEHIDWIIYANEFFVGLVALPVSYYGNKIHRISWIGGLTIFQAISGAVLLVPEIYRKNQENSTENDLCEITFTPKFEINYIALVILLVFQLILSAASISFITHGLTYIDDNTLQKKSPGYIGVALAFKELGKHAGFYISWVPLYTKIKMVFVSPIWLVIMFTVFLTAILISMFPRNLPSILVQKMSASLIDLASGYRVQPPKQTVDGFFKTFVRLLKNKILMTNILCSVFMQSGLINFDIFEKYFIQSRFLISLLNDASYIQFTTKTLKQPLVAISLIASGFLAAKTKPHLKSLVKWNIIAIILVIIFFGSAAFLKCKPSIKYSQMMVKNDCIYKCNCIYSEFHPICYNNNTYYSPCYATVDHQVHTNKCNCNCSRFQNDEYEGICSGQKCEHFFAFLQLNRVFITTLIATTLITNLIINMRCILSKDKATALGLEVTLTILIPYLPVKVLYGIVTKRFFCESSSIKSLVCRIYSKSVADFLAISTLCFMIFSLIMAVFVLILLKRYPVEENDQDDDDDNPVELEDMSSRDGRNRLMNEQNNDDNHLTLGSANSISESLLEMENVGDDHDSIESGPYLDDTPRINRRRVIESDL